MEAIIEEQKQIISSLKIEISKLQSSTNTSECNPDGSFNPQEISGIIYRSYNTNDLTFVPSNTQHSSQTKALNAHTDSEEQLLLQLSTPSNSKIKTPDDSEQTHHPEQKELKQFSRLFKVGKKPIKLSSNKLPSSHVKNFNRTRPGTSILSDDDNTTGSSSGSSFDPQQQRPRSTPKRKATKTSKRSKQSKTPSQNKQNLQSSTQSQNTTLSLDSGMSLSQKNNESFLAKLKINQQSMETSSKSSESNSSNSSKESKVESSSPSSVTSVFDFPFNSQSSLVDSNRANTTQRDTYRIGNRKILSSQQSRSTFIRDVNSTLS